MKRLWPVFLCLLIILLGISFIPGKSHPANAVAQVYRAAQSSRAAQTDSAATLTPLAGLVQIQSIDEDPYSATGWHTVTAPVPIHQSDRVRTNGVGRAAITFFAGAETQIQPNSLIQVSTLILPGRNQPYSIALDVLVGSVLSTFSTAPADPNRFVILTPYASAAGHAAQWCTTSTPQGESIFSTEAGSIDIMPYVGSPLSVEVGGAIVFPYGAISPLASAACTDMLPPRNVPLVKPTCGNGRFEPGEDQTCLLDYPLLSGLLPSCGNNACEPENGEDLVLCPRDCSPAEGYLCGDGTCQLSESGVTCPVDCWPDQSLGPQNPLLCGDGTCDPGESALSCPADCAADPPAAAQLECGDRLCSADETAETCPADCANPRAICGDQICDQTAGENAATCARDCAETYQPVCGDLFCDGPAGEDASTCVQDCGTELICTCGQSASWSGRRTGCGDGLCALTAGESLQTCPADCTAPPRICGDRRCDPRLGENASTCPDDCANRYNPHPTPTPPPTATPRPTTVPRITPRPTITPTATVPPATAAPAQPNPPSNENNNPPPPDSGPGEPGPEEPVVGPQPVCGDGIVEGSEECDPPNGAECSDGCYRLSCGDTMCSAQIGENPVTCPQDCGGGCGDFICSPQLNEDVNSCPQDCGSCGDGTCSTSIGESVLTCPSDCPSVCGDTICYPDGGEDCTTCSADCGPCPEPGP